MALGAKLRAERESQGLSREALARKSETSVSAILRTETKGDHPRTRTLRKWAIALNVPVAALLDESDPEAVAS